MRGPTLAPVAPAIGPRGETDDVRSIALLFFPFAMAFAASTDLLTMRISNKLVLLLVVGFLIMAIAISMPLQQFAMHVACAVLVLAVGFAFFALRFDRRRRCQAGCCHHALARLRAGAALSGLFGAFLAASLTLAILALRRLPLTPFLARYRWLERLHDNKSGVPYGIALAIAGMITYSNSAIFQRLAA